MTDVLTRKELLRKAAAGGAVLSLPGILAACGGSSSSSSSAGSSSSRELAKTLRFSNWTLYIDAKGPASEGCGRRSAPLVPRDPRRLRRIELVEQQRRELEP